MRVCQISVFVIAGWYFVGMGINWLLDFGASQE